MYFIKTYNKYIYSQLIILTKTQPK